MVRYLDLVSDTICSPITPSGVGGVSVIRISGARALEILKSITQKKHFKPRTSYLVTIIDRDKKPIDQVMALYFEENHSFTGDETVELSCHGNPLIVQNIMGLLLTYGARVAEKGEFSFRAFYNNRIDLVQAESIQNLITTKNRNSSDHFLNQLTGSLSSTFFEIESQLILALSHLEASIDFSEEDLETKDYSSVQSIISILQSKIEDLVQTYDVGRTLSQAPKVIILGQPNVGKSSIFNQLIGDDRAIVTDIAGTTRDLVTSTKRLDHLEFEFIDSAGIRDTKDPIEQIGIQKGLSKAAESALILYVVDSINPSSSDKQLILENFDRTLFIFNKSDLLANVDEQKSKLKYFSTELGCAIDPAHVYFCSALTSTGLNALSDAIEARFRQKSPDAMTAVVTQARHFNHLCDLLNHLKKANELLLLNESPDLISQELSLGLFQVLQILGKEYNDEVLDKIFQEFCLGK